MPVWIKLLQSDLAYASRDLREASAVREAGFDVLAVRVVQRSAQNLPNAVRGVPMRYIFDRMPRQKMSPRILSVFSIPFRYFSLAGQLAKYSAAVISGHDIYALLMAWVSLFFTPKNRRPKLVYDAHEFELGRNAQRGKWELWGIVKLEGFLMKRSAFTIAVNDSIADAMQQVHGVKQRPVVARSMPEYWQLDEGVIAGRREELLEQLGQKEPAFLVMYHGGIVPMRGIEMLIRAVGANPALCGVVMGCAMKPAYKEALVQLAEKEGAKDRVLFLPAVPQPRIWEYAGAADLECVLIDGSRHKSYYLCLPNKFFESVQSGTPVLVSDYPELGRMARQYDIGLACEPTDFEEVSAHIERLRTDRALYRRCKQNVLKAKQTLCWEKEKTALVEAYKKL